MFTAIGFVMLYSNLYGAKLSYELCNTSDIAIYVDREVDDVEKNRNNEKWKFYFDFLLEFFLEMKIHMGGKFYQVSSEE